jgi:death on curing protein
MVERAQAEQLKEHGGLLGLRDEGLLESALDRSRNRWAYDPETTLFELAASYGFGLAKNHAFLDGNKRIAFVAMNMFLLLNGQEIEAPETEVVDTMLAVAAGDLDEADLGRWLERVVVPFEF